MDKTDEERFYYSQGGCVGSVFEVDFQGLDGE